MRKCNASVAAAIFGLGGPPLETLQTLAATTMAARKSRVPMVALALTVALMVGLPAWMVPNSFPSSRQNLWRMMEKTPFWGKWWGRRRLSFVILFSQFTLPHSSYLYSLYNILIFMSNTSAACWCQISSPTFLSQTFLLKRSRIAPSPRVSTAMLHTSPSVGTWSLALAVCAVAASGPALRARQRKGHTQRRAENEVPKYLEAPEDQTRVLWEKT